MRSVLPSIRPGIRRVSRLETAMLRREQVNPLRRKDDVKTIERKKSLSPTHGALCKGRAFLFLLFYWKKSRSESRPVGIFRFFISIRIRKERKEFQSDLKLSTETGS